MDNLFQLIKKSQDGNQNCTLEIIKKFSPLINKYSRKLNYDGSETDLIICILETVLHIPILKDSNMKREECIINYIHISVKRQYIRLSKKYNVIYNKEIELNTDIIGVYSIENDLNNHLIINQLLDKLPFLQLSIIKDIYLNDISESYIANKLNISRQAVNRTKNRALNSLKKTYLS